MDKRSGSGLSAQIGDLVVILADGWRNPKTPAAPESTAACFHLLPQGGRKPFQREGFGNRNGFANAACAGRKAIQNKQLRK